MKYQSTTLFAALVGMSMAAPMPKAAPSYTLRGREVPQEHSHNKFLASVRTSLNLNNPDKIQDPVFGLLGNGAAAAGAGSITNLDCLHQATADQAFTNAKAANDVASMGDALVFAALERNTAGVGKASVICSETAVNPEIAAIQQHQDPASTGAAAGNKAVTLALAKQLAAIGDDPQKALQSGTFAPGDVSDNTGAGNTCDTADDVEGCIFSQNLLVEDATAAEIDAAVAGVAVASGAATATAAAAATTAAAAATTAAAAATTAAAAATTAAASAAATTDGCVAVAVTVTVEADGSPASTAAAVATDAAAATTTAAAAATATAVAASGDNVQTFTGSLGAPPVPVTKGTGDRPFTVKGNTFVNIGAALQRSCAVQNNACSDAVNSGKVSGSTVGDCNAQETACNAAASA